METTQVSIDGWLDKEYTYTHTHTHTVKYYSAIKNVIFGNMDWLDLKGITLSEINQRKINTVLPHFYVDHKEGAQR